MGEKTNFIVYCIEEYKAAKDMSGKSVIDLFNHYRVIDYIRDYYEALHTTGRQYIVDDISMYIEAGQSSMTGCREGRKQCSANTESGILTNGQVYSFIIE